MLRLQKKKECLANMKTVQRSNAEQEKKGGGRCSTNTDRISKPANNSTKSMIKTNPDKSTNNFLAGPNCDSDKRKSAETTQQIHKEFDDVFNDIGCFEGTFSLLIKTDSKPYQVPPLHISYALQKPLQEELERLQQQDIITLHGVDETLEWCNSFVLVPKANGKVRLHLDPAWLNQALIRLVHRGTTLNNILPKINKIQYLSLMDVSSRNCNLLLDKKPSHLTTFTCQFDIYRYKWLPFGAAPAGDMFQQKNDEIFNDMPNVFGIVDAILVAGYDTDGKDHNGMVQRVLQRCREVNIKLNKEKCHFRCTSVPFFGEVILRNGVQPDPQKSDPLWRCHLTKKRAPGFSGHY